jgi:hypothetical protein
VETFNAALAAVTAAFVLGTEVFRFLRERRADQASEEPEGES